METPWNATNDDMDSDNYARCNLPVDQKYNVDRELRKIMEAVDDAMELFMYIRLALALGEDYPTIIAFINPPFDPLRTIGKYTA